MEIRRQRRDYLDPAAVETIESELMRMQELAFQAEWTRVPAWSIQRIADDRMMFLRKVNADLVCPAGMEPCLDQGIAA